MSSTNDTALLQRYEELRDAGIAATAEGRFREALALLEDACHVVLESGDENLEDLAFCNWAGVKIELSDADEVLPDLRQVLMRSADPATCRVAGYQIARIYELRGEHKKGLFYARIARDRTAQLEPLEPIWIANNHNQIANFLVADSRFQEALDEYRIALDAEPNRSGYRFFAMRQNMGYCHMMLGRPYEGLGLLYESLRALRRLNMRPLLALNYLDLAYAHLEIGRSRVAIKHAERGLRYAIEHDDQPNVKNALYLLGEAWHQSGNDAEARKQFERLADCYEDLPFIVDFLLTVDVRRMINLRA